jgi:hypothetical protein
MFKLLFLLCFYSGGKIKMLKLLGCNRSRVSALPQAATSAPGVRKAGEYQGETLEMWYKPYFEQILFCSKWLAVTKRYTRKRLFLAKYDLYSFL